MIESMDTDKLTSASLRELTDSIKSTRGCADCKNEFRPVALGFDHIPERGPKLFHVSAGARYGREAVLAEIAKCEVVCHNCHSIRTNERARAKSLARGPKPFTKREQRLLGRAEWTGIKSHAKLTDSR